MFIFIGKYEKTKETSRKKKEIKPIEPDDTENM